MIRKSVLLALVACLSLALLVPRLVQAQAQSELVVLVSSAQAEFPSRLDFSLSAESNTNITDIRLHYIVDMEGFAQVTSEVYIEFVPATTADVGWTWDMRKTGGLPPGSSVDYWWVVEDDENGMVETAPAKVNFDDFRYPWRSLTEGKLTLYWYEGRESFAQELMTTAWQALVRLTGDTGAELEKPVKLYIYATPQDLQGAMIYPQEWTGGAAFTRYSTIVIGIAPDKLLWGKGAIAHELAHLVIHQATFNPYGGLPTWLSEGLATYAEGAFGSKHATYINKAIAEGSLISVHSLSSPFSAYAEESYLSYGQSYSLVEFLINGYGQGRMLKLLNTFRQGSSYDAALEEVYGFDMDGLDGLWRDYITR